MPSAWLNDPDFKQDFHYSCVAACVRIQFLQQAQETVHRTTAPRMGQSIKRWLPQFTAGRYHDVRVDPESLDVQVCGAGN